MPSGPATFCDTYPASPLCAMADVACTACHSAAPNLNPYGEAISAALLPGEPRPLTEPLYTSGLPAALAAIEDDDTDGDGFSNLDEIIEGTLPGNGDSVPENLECPPNDFYDLCEYDFNFAFKRVALDICGQSPTWDEMEAFRAIDTDAGKQSSLDAKLSSCLDSDFWQGAGGVLSALANRKVRPVGTLKAGEGPGNVAIADYDHDYDLFVWSQTDGRDARLAMTAQYFVDRDETGALFQLTEEELGNFQGPARENVPVEQRAGLLTTAWTLLYFEMFAIIPRAAAAQASRAWLREDWAKMEGLSPVAGTVDYDNAGITAPGCIPCHSTIEGAAWAYQNYAGFVGQGGNGRASFVPDRMNLFENAFPGISDMPTGFFKGEPVTDLVDWASKAANSDPFAKATTMDYWQILVNFEPTGGMEIDEFNELWQTFRGTDNYSVEAMLFKLIRTRSYGEP